MIEMAVAAAMVGLLGLAIFAAFNNGVRVFQRVKQPLVQEDLAVFLSKFTADVHNSLAFSRLQPVYAGSHLELVTQVKSPKLRSYSVGKVIYTYDPGSSTFFRQQYDMSDLYTQGAPGVSQAIAQVSALKFSYYVFDEQKNEDVWVDDYTKTGFPQAVRLELDIGDGKDATKVTKTVTVPVSARR